MFNSYLEVPLILRGKNASLTRPETPRTSPGSRDAEFSLAAPSTWNAHSRRLVSSECTRAQVLTGKVQYRLDLHRILHSFDLGAMLGPRGCRYGHRCAARARR